MNKVIEIRSIKIETIVVAVIGESPLIMHSWSSKAKQEMLDKQRKKAAKGRAIRDPEAEYKEAFYGPPDNGATPYGFKSIAFKSATTSAARGVKDLTLVTLRACFKIPDELVPIYGEPEMFDDFVRVGGRGPGTGSADLRFRPIFRNWASEFVVKYNADVISAEQLISLIHAGGFSSGVGEMRQEKGGRYGAYRLAQAGEIEQWKGTKLKAVK